MKRRTPDTLIHAPWIQIYRSVDWGFWPDPAVCLWIAVLGKRLLVFKERLWHRTIAKDVAKDIVEDSRGMHVVNTYCDPTMDIKTGADIYTIKDIFEQHGVPLELSINNREHFATAIHSALGEEVEPGVPRLQILKSGCPNLVRYLPQMTFNPHAPAKMADHKHDHLPVALAYFLMSHIPVTKPKAPSSTAWYVRAGYGPDTTRKVLGSDNIRHR